jgi:diacylglycerol kinase (ATP)
LLAQPEGLIVAKPDNTGIMRAVRAARFSAQGFVHAWRHESAFRQELTLGVLLTPLAVWLGQTALERALLIACLLLVLIVELLNSAVEAAVDRFGDEHHELSGRAKDLGSAAVSLSLGLVLLVWSAVAWSRFTG